jgi:Zn-dependent protease
VQAVLWLILGIVIVKFQVSENYFYEVVNAGVLVNCVIFAFNLVPVPPLDGGRVVMGLLPTRAAIAYSRIEPYGFFVVMALVITGVLNVWMAPIVGVMQSLLALMVQPFL